MSERSWLVSPFIPLLLSRVFPCSGVEEDEEEEEKRNKERIRKKEQHYAIYVYTLRHAMICQRPEAKNTGGEPLR